MKFFKILLGAAICFNVFGIKAQNNEQQNFNYYFSEKTLRIDYLLAGNDTSEKFILKDLQTTTVWAGAKRLADTLQLLKGNYLITLFDSSSNKTLYQTGFSTLFQEWQATPDAKRNWQAHYQVNLVPFPLKTVKIRLSKSNYDDLNYTIITEFFLNPSNKFIRNEKALNINYSVIKGGGDINKKVDIAFLAEGYTRDEMGKFRSDCRKVWDYISSLPPYNSMSENFNIYAVESGSAESGVDIPEKHIYKNTIMGFSFSTFDISRYLSVPDVKTLHDIASVVPYDYIFVLINSTEYGGSGFYNFFTATTVDHQYSLKVAIHEFGHCFAGLADEYYSSSVAVESYYSMKREPWEPNITTLIDFKTKWQLKVDSAIPVPTPRIALYANNVGVFEGGGYSSKGIYSPYQDCAMKSNNVKLFCPVCEQAIREVINSLCQ